jgi:hypothetical protein
MRIIEQADRTGDRTTYTWMLARSYQTRSEMERWGWKWLPGHRCRGTFVTNDIAAVFRAVSVLRLPAPESNGSHARLGVPMSCDA